MEQTHKPAITISGTLGSGKTTAANKLAEILGFPQYSGGFFARTVAAERGLSMKEFSEMAESDPQIDKEIDSRTVEFMRAHENYIADCRLGWYWEPAAFKVFLTLSDEVAADRILNDLKTNELRAAGERSYTREEVLEKIRHRLGTERVRYQKYYGIENNHDPKHYDIVIDTSNLTPDEVVARVLEGYRAWIS